MNELREPTAFWVFPPINLRLGVFHEPSVLNSFSSGRKVAILSGVVLNAYIFQTIHCTETEIASFERGGLPLQFHPELG
jgi:hypothetical protein